MKREGAIRPFNKATFVFLKAEGVRQINRTSECWLHEKCAFCWVFVISNVFGLCLYKDKTSIVCSAQVFETVEAIPSTR